MNVILGALIGIVAVGNCWAMVRMGERLDTIELTKREEL